MRSKDINLNECKVNCKTELYFQNTQGQTTRDGVNEVIVCVLLIREVIKPGKAVFLDT